MSTRGLSESDVDSFLDAGNETSGGDGGGPGDPITKATIRATLDQLRPYDRNPRQSRNPKFDSILNSIEAAGLDHAPNISRRHPDDPSYLIIDGGNTRLEILNILYDKYKGLAETAETDEERLAHHEKAQSFHVIDCIFKPWKNESGALTGHMRENEERGDTLFIEKALAVQDLRQIYREEDQSDAEVRSEPFEYKPLTIRALAERITAQGWTVSNSHISRFEYAAEQLLPAIPAALWAGAGQPLIISIRRLEKAYFKFWASVDAGRDNPQRIRDLFFGTLREFDEENLDIEGFTQALDSALATDINLPAMTIRAEVGALMTGGISPSQPPAEVPSPNTDGSKTVDAQTAPETRKKGRHQSKVTPTSGTPQTREQVCEAILGEATVLANAYQLVVAPFPSNDPTRHSAWFILHPLDEIGVLPVPGQDDARAAVWWALFRVSATWQHIPDMQAVFNAAFATYLTHEPAMTVIDTVLLLHETETGLPDDVRAQLDDIARLALHGTGLKEVT